VSGLLVLRGDSAYYTRDVIAAARRSGVRFSVTARKDKAVSAAIAAVPDVVDVGRPPSGRCPPYYLP